MVSRAHSVKAGSFTSRLQVGMVQTLSISYPTRSHLNPLYPCWQTLQLESAGPRDLLLASRQRLQGAFSRCHGLPQSPGKTIILWIGSSPTWVMGWLRHACELLRIVARTLKCRSPKRQRSRIIKPKWCRAEVICSG